MVTERKFRPDLKPELPPSIFRPATADELVHRRAAWDRLMKLRRDIGPIKGITTAQLLTEEGEEVDG